MYKELVFELAGGQPDGALTRFFFERNMTARMRVIHATPDASWESIHVTGRPEDVADLQATLNAGAVPPMDDVEIIATAPRSLRYVVKWRRSPGSGGLALDFLLHDTVGPDAIYGMTIRAGRILVTVAAADGEKLLQYFTRVREELAHRYTVRLVRVGDMSESVRPDPAFATTHLRAEDRDLVELALTSGYYDSPKRCGVRELGDALGCSKSVVARKLRNIERRALESLLRPMGRRADAAADAAPPVPAALDVYAADTVRTLTQT